MTLTTFMQDLPFVALIVIIVIFLFLLSKGADILVEEAVALSIRWGIPSVVIGATIVSLGTTLPEMAVSVMGAVRGNPGLALGNAVGSIIADTGLILGLAALIKPLPLRKEVVNRQGWIQVGSGFLLVLACFPWSNPGAAFSEGGTLPQWLGWVFLGLLVLYIYKSIIWSKSSGEAGEAETEALQHSKKEENTTSIVLFLKLCLGIGLVLISSQILIPAVEETAVRLSVPDAIIAATLVALGTSLPELVTAITAVRRNHGELAVGNVIGADILNVLFVAGAAASVTPGGLVASGYFFNFLFPAMILLLVVFRVGIFVSKTHLTRPFGALMIAIYLGVTVVSYMVGVDMH